MLFIAIDIQ